MHTDVVDVPFDRSAQGEKTPSTPIHQIIEKPVEASPTGQWTMVVNRKKANPKFIHERDFLEYQGP
jgi:hypothetical protein